MPVIGVQSTALAHVHEDQRGRELRKCRPKRNYGCTNVHFEF